MTAPKLYMAKKTDGTLLGGLPHTSAIGAVRAAAAAHAYGTDIRFDRHGLWRSDSALMRAAKRREHLVTIVEVKVVEVKP